MLLDISMNGRNSYNRRLVNHLFISDLYFLLSYITVSLKRFLKVYKDTQDFCTHVEILQAQNISLLNIK